MVKFNGIIVKENGILFFFKNDTTDPSQLHIYVRHLTTIDNALEVFFEGTGIWNEENQRFETLNETHGLYWFWLNPEKTKVMVITCFRLDKES